MRHRKVFLVPLLIVLMLVGACSNSVWDELPSAISSFISEYFPGVGVSSFNEDDDYYYVKVRNGASLTFNKEYNWTEVDGNGVALPDVFMYDQLPPDLYNYLKGIEQQSDVYGVKRDKDFYKLTMHDTVITYDIKTGKITYPNGTSVDSDKLPN